MGCTERRRTQEKGADNQGASWGMVIHQEIGVKRKTATSLLARVSRASESSRGVRRCGKILASRCAPSYTCFVVCDEKTSLGEAGAWRQGTGARAETEPGDGEQGAVVKVCVGEFISVEANAARIGSRWWWWSM